MASPHITGLAACLIGKDPSKYPTPALLTAAITALANKNTRVVPPVPAGTKTLLGYNGI